MDLSVRTRSISSHAVLGDGRSAALVADDGTVDWLCWPDFDSPAVFAAILDAERGGGLRVGPADEALPPARRYLDHTHVLETRWANAGGALRVTDWMALLPERGRGYAPGHELLRIAACDEGEVEVEIAADLRPGFGARGVRLRPAGPLGVRLELPGALYTLRATAPLAYGEVVDAVARLVRPGATLDRATQALLRDLGRFVCGHWQEPDSGIWEPREPPRHRTHSLVLAWTALDRLLALHAAGALRGLPVDDVEEHRRAIRARVERDGWSERLQSYVSELGGDRVDAALLLLPWYGFADAGAPRMRATWRRIRERLGAGPGLLYRYEPSLAAGEGAFGACSFWEAEYLARGGGSLAEARSTFEAACAHANDLGLFAEEIDPRTGAALGNFPQAFTHVGLLDAAVSIGRRARAEAAPGATREGEVRA